MRTLAMALILGLCATTASAAPRRATVKRQHHVARSVKPAKPAKQAKMKAKKGGAKHASAADGKLMQPKWL
jgi:hypothetical protein